MLPAIIRAIRLTFALIICYLAFFLLWLKRLGRVSLRDRAIWMHHSCRRVAHAFRLSLHSAGPVPTSGLIVSNHLGYLDILAFAAATPCVFVSKQDLLAWPVFGTLARFGATIFVNRDLRSAVDSISRQIAATLQSGLPVVLFPEGTSTDGSHLLPFHSSLIEPAIRSNAPITAAAIGYQSASCTESHFCYYGDLRFVPHLLKILCVPGTHILLRFHPAPTPFTNRKQAAELLRRQISDLRAPMRPAQPVLTN